VSNFFHYFSYNFEKLGLKKLITTCYKSQTADLFSQNNSEQAVYLAHQGNRRNRLQDTVASRLAVGPKQRRCRGTGRERGTPEIAAPGR